MVSEKTLYNLLNAGAFSATKLDCPRIVRMRPRQKTPAPKVDRHCYDGRTYDDFIRFMEEHPDTPVAQMDSVIGRKGGKVLLTISFRTAICCWHFYETITRPGRLLTFLKIFIAA